MIDSGIAARVAAIAEKSAAEYGLELVHVEVAGAAASPTVRVFVDKPDGVTHSDCAQVSLHIGTLLDVEDFISSAYTLEVSSPGLERGLYKLADYERFAGKRAKLKVRVPIGGQRNFAGTLAGVEDGAILFDDKTSGRVTIPIETVVKANLEIDIEEEFRRAESRKMSSEQ
jgi:ribosome maturation factor RimP